MLGGLIDRSYKVITGPDFLYLKLNNQKSSQAQTRL